MQRVIDHRRVPSTVKLSAESSISTEVPNQTLLVAPYFAQPGEIEVSIGMSRVKLDASLVRRRSSIKVLEFFQGDGAIEVQQRVIGKVLQRLVKNRQRLFTPRFSLAQQHTQIGVRAVVRAGRGPRNAPSSAALTALTGGTRPESAGARPAERPFSRPTCLACLSRPPTSSSDRRNTASTACSGARSSSPITDNTTGPCEHRMPSRICRKPCATPASTMKLLVGGGVLTAIFSERNIGGRPPSFGRAVTAVVRAATPDARYVFACTRRTFQWDRVPARRI